MERRYLHINLTDRKIETKEIPEEIALGWVGGRGFGIKYLYDSIEPGIDPLSPDNKLFLVNGPLAGTGAMGCSRWFAVTKSPLTKTYMRSSGGGDFGAWMGFAGFDFFLIEGKAEKPSYLLIEKDKWEIIDADFIWGKLTSETDEALVQKHGKDARVACIGPASEKGVMFGMIIESKRRSASRGGVGTVMGSKNLKAVVVKGKGPRPVADPSLMKELIQQETYAHRASIMYEEFCDTGTIAMAGAVNDLGMYPVKNFREGSLEGFENLSADVFFKDKIGNCGCYQCMVHCGNLLKITSKGEYEGKEIDGPDYETLNLFSGSVGATDAEAIKVGNAMCDDLGMDTIGVGNSIGFAYELFEKGLITKEDTGGLELKYGDTEAMLEMIKKIGTREDIGDILAEGTRKAGLKIGNGAGEYAMEIKGLEIPAYDLRGAKGHGLSMITSPIGANHCIGYNTQEIFGVPFPRPVTNRFEELENIDVAIFNQMHVTFCELGISCTFVGGAGMLTPLLMAKMLGAVTGKAEFSIPGNLFRIAEKIWNLERIFNLREGFRREDDSAPLRFLEEPIKNARATTGQTIHSLGAMLDKYYAMRGWDESGVPTPEKLKELGLEDMIETTKTFE